MTVANNYAPVVQAANSVTTAFSGPWNAISAANITVQLLNTTTGVYTPVSQGTGGTQYQVDTVTASGFTLHFNTAPASGNNVIISRTTPQQQTQPYTTSRGFQGSVEEGSFDALTAMLQENQDAINRSLKANVGSGIVPLLINPPVDQVVLAWSGTGGNIGNGPSVAQISSAAANAAIASNAAASAILASQNAPVYNCPTVTGTNTIALTTTASVAAYADGQIFEFTPANSISGAATANVNTIGSFPILDEAGNALTTGAVNAGIPTAIMKKGGNFYLMLDPRNQKSGGSVVDNSVNDFRLTLTSGVPVTTADVTGATSIKWTPAKGNRIALFSSGAWNIRTSIELPLSLGTLVSNTTYDLFIFDNAGTPNMELSAAWNSSTPGSASIFSSGPYATTRPLQDGVYVKSTNGTAVDATRRYVGSFTTTSTTTTEDSVANRHVFNYSNRVERNMLRQESATSWTYSLNTPIRQANANTANQLNFTIGMPEDIVTATVQVAAFNSTTAVAAVMASIGLNSTTAIAANTINTSCGVANNLAQPIGANFKGICPIGNNTLTWIELGNGALTQTFQSTQGAAYGKSGLIGTVRA